MFSYVKAIVFDFDGTIIDTEQAVLEAWREVFDAHGCPVPMERWGEVVGTATRTFDPYAYIEERIGKKVDRRQVDAARRRRELELIAHLEPRPGVVRLLEEARSNGIKVGLATNSHQAWVDMHLGAAGLLDAFHAFATADDVAAGKPDPAVYRLAVRRLGVLPHEAVAVEDSPHGALGALRAGLICIVAPGEVTRHMQFPEVHAIWDSLEAVRLSDLESVWRSAETSGKK